MSTFKVEVVKIDEVVPHPNADRLDLLKIRGWQCVSAKGQFQSGDLCVYFPIDSILPSDLEATIFGKDSKVKLSNSRVKTIKLRGAISQGLAIKPEILELQDAPEGDDLTKWLNIKKYEAPVSLPHQGGKVSTYKQTNPNFNKYTDIENAKNFPDLFSPDEQVVVTEKIHGTNFRAGYVPFYANSLWKKFLQYFNLSPKWEFVYGSHNVQLQNKLRPNSYYDSNVYAEAVKQYELMDRLQPGEVVYGEIYGDGIQKGYTYGCLPGERKIVLFDMKLYGEWVNYDNFKSMMDLKGLPTAPEFYIGPFDKEVVLSFRDGESILSPTQKVREGVVVKPLLEQTTYCGRKILKYISDNYLLKNQENESEAH